MSDDRGFARAVCSWRHQRLLPAGHRHIGKSIVTNCFLSSHPCELTIEAHAIGEVDKAVSKDFARFVDVAGEERSLAREPKPFVGILRPQEVIRGLARLEPSHEYRDEHGGSPAPLIAERMGVTSLMAMSSGSKPTAMVSNSQPNVASDETSYAQGIASFELPSGRR